MARIGEVDRKILQEIYPNVRFTDDLDIERYFELRQAGQMQTALSLYNDKLKRKYPDEQMRVKLLTFYRTRDPRFYDVLTENLQLLATSTTTKIKRVIVYITDTIAKVNTKDVFSLIQIVEALVSSFQMDRFSVISEAEKYTRFAHILGFRNQEMKNASEFIRMYITDTLASVTEYKAEQARLKQKEAEIRRTTSSIQTFDFSKVVFSKGQIAEIILPNENIQIEDKVLSYIAKYWDKAYDSRFENMVLLYSRKYKTKHYDIFNSIKTARFRNWQDSELLHSVLSNVVSGYYYSISGDLYLHKNWQRIKPVLKSGNSINWTPTHALEIVSKPEIIQSEQKILTLDKPKQRSVTIEPKIERRRVALITDKETIQAFNSIKDETKTIKVRSTTHSINIPFSYYQRDPNTQGSGLLITHEQLLEEQKKQEEKYALMKQEEHAWLRGSRIAFKENAKRLSENEKMFLEQQRREARKKGSDIKTSIVSSPNVQTNTGKKPAVVTPQPNSKGEKKSRTTLKKNVKKVSAPKRERKSMEEQGHKKKNVSTKNTHLTFFVPRKNNNFDPAKRLSIEQMIKNATGKNYVIHKDIFFKSVRTSIRHVLNATTMKKQSLFKSEQNMAENIIYVFLQRNYSNLYQDWDTSNAKDEVFQLGFNVSSLDMIIKHWASSVL